MKRGFAAITLGKQAFRYDRIAIGLMWLAAPLLFGAAWLAMHPEHDPRAPLDLRDPPGWATERKLLALRGDPELCRAVLTRSKVAFTMLPPQGEGACARPDRVVLDDIPLSPDRPPTSCAVSSALHLWLERGVKPAALETFGSPLASIEHYGAFSCRRLYGQSDGRWSEHATGNAIDIAGFLLEDDTRISVLNDWQDEGGTGDKARFLRMVREHACDSFATVLSPDYNAAHGDHFHFDQQDRGFGGVCR
ncbi:hypothetical protein HME9302_01018 [Alteripontixanthobacter maritimus]|uniref:Extensin-like C-terminal domain-containing protein n=1 Tax=Alteripontixanthobacter maritimus TaxID=2161824 RepID=A0A369Q4K2_9SPHN|nr:extensin family protein [Alteripontixanthobacter maritimus]RDC59823.1 hypothetical protein HME9302_01018 [Alteripontixanthobacter maritimus]